MFTTKLYDNMRISQYILRIGIFFILLTAVLAVQAQEENMKTLFDLNHLLDYLVAAFLISVFVMIFYNRVIYFREKEVRKEAERLNAQLALIMSANKSQVWTYDIKQNKFTTLSQEDLQETLYTPYEFSQFFEREDFDMLRKVIEDIKDGNLLTDTITIKGAIAKDNEAKKQNLYEVTVSVLSRDRHEHPTVIVGSQRDITEEHSVAEKTNNLMQRYQTIFNSSQVDMYFYDADGFLTGINDKALETFKIPNRRALIEHKVNIKNLPAYYNWDISQIPPMFISSITDIDKHKREDEKIPDIRLGGKNYYEANLKPLRDKDGKFLGVVIAGRNITDMVETEHHQKEMSRIVEQRLKDIQDYVANLNYSLKISEVRLINYYPKTHELEISKDLGEPEYLLTQIRCMSLIHPEDKPKVKQLLMRMDRKVNTSIAHRLHTILKDKDGRDIYLFLNMMPITDKEGKITHYFGIFRNETEMTYTELKLEEETKKALEEEQLKNTFLLNMSHELRTPLNAVIGFAELFNTDHAVEDEAIFAEEIKKNTNILLALINDILYLSRLDAHMIEYNYQQTDIAPLFEGWCYMGWSKMNPNVKQVVENPFSELIVNIDPQNLQNAIQKLCSYSCLTTKEGMVHARYEYRQGELMITIEDTSNGMDAKALQNAFNRFVHEEESQHVGTGLDLPTVKALIEQMNGSIELQSELGKGNSFFVSIPCEMISLVKKAEIQI